MIESFTLATLCMLYLIFFRPGKTPPLQNPLIIERPGQYRLTLAPQLNLAQPFIENFAGRIAELAEAWSNTIYFEVHDNRLKAHGCAHYLLALTRIDGMLYVEAARPKSGEVAANFTTIKAQEIQARCPEAEECGKKIAGVVLEVAGQSGIRVGVLTV